MALFRALVVATVPMADAELTQAQWKMPALTQDIVNRINRDPSSTWVAEISPRFKDATLGDVAALCGVRDDSSLQSAVVREYNSTNSLPVPNSLDWRTKMGDQCPGITRIKDQANCGSCWVFGAVEVMEDRACIGSGGSMHLDLSEQDVVSCDSVLGGCSGGNPMTAWNYFHEDGIVTSSCYPYAREPCNHASAKGNPDYPDCPPDAGTEPCNKTCVNGQPWDAAKVRNGNAPYRVIGEAAIEQELLQKGPVTVVYTVYQDFPAYKSGIYRPSWPPVQLGGHAVAIYGFGEENGTPYWLVKNSWNAGWGENGWFRILKGGNACGIENGLSSSQTPCAADVATGGSFAALQI